MSMHLNTLTITKVTVATCFESKCEIMVNSSALRWDSVLFFWLIWKIFSKYTNVDPYVAEAASTLLKFPMLFVQQSCETASNPVTTSSLRASRLYPLFISFGTHWYHGVDNSHLMFFWRFCSPLSLVQGVNIWYILVNTCFSALMCFFLLLYFKLKLNENIHCCKWIMILNLLKYFTFLHFFLILLKRFCKKITFHCNIINKALWQCRYYNK